MFQWLADLGKRRRIGRLRAHTVYRRQSGQLFIKLNKTIHVRTKLGSDKDGRQRWLGDGIAYRFDPKEEVRVIQKR